VEDSIEPVLTPKEDGAPFPTQVKFSQQLYTQPVPRTDRCGLPMLNVLRGVESEGCIPDGWE
jgi:hypothetical protein